MKRPIFLAISLLTVDQLLKWYFQVNFEGKTLLFTKNFGFTYKINPGIWIHKSISNASMFLIQIGVLFLVFIGLFMVKYYHAYYRRSLWIDLSFAFLITAAFGNVIFDRIFFGYIRDYFINPIAVSNFADICSEIALFFFIIEIILYPKARSLLRIGTPKEWIRNVQTFYNFVMGKR